MNNDLDYIQTKTNFKNLGHEIYHDPQLEKNNEFSMDQHNVEIIQFCSYLFNNWLEDYAVYAEKMKDRNLTHHHYDMN